MKKSYIFKSKDGKEITIRGAGGLHKWGELRDGGFVNKVHDSGFAITIETKFGTEVELKVALGV